MIRKLLASNGLTKRIGLVLEHALQLTRSARRTPTPRTPPTRASTPDAGGDSVGSRNPRGGSARATADGPGVPVGARRITWTFFGVPVKDHEGTRLMDLTVTSKDQASRTGRLLSDIGRLRAGTISPADFSRRWRGVVIAGAAVEWRPGHVLEASRQSGPPPGAERYRRTVRWGSS